jgi:hypothetical protein
LETKIENWKTSLGWLGGWLNACSMYWIPQPINVEAHQLTIDNFNGTILLSLDAICINTCINALIFNHYMNIWKNFWFSCKHNQHSVWRINMCAFTCIFTQVSSRL